MKSRLHMALLLIASAFLTSLTAATQQSATEAAAMATSNVVPSLINYTGVLKDAGGRTLTSVTGVTLRRDFPARLQDTSCSIGV